jgi:hypothetical protein
MIVLEAGFGQIESIYSLVQGDNNLVNNVEETCCNIFNIITKKGFSLSNNPANDKGSYLS